MQSTGARLEQAGVAEPFADGDVVAGLFSPARQIGQLLHVLDVHQPGPAQVDFVARLEWPLDRDRLVVETGAVQAAQVADDPGAVGQVDFGVFPAAQFVLEDDAVGAGPAEREATPGLQREHLPEPIVQSDDQIGGGGWHRRP